jgi:hypothetical protein
MAMVWRVGACSCRRTGAHFAGTCAISDRAYCEAGDDVALEQDRQHDRRTIAITPAALRKEKPDAVKSSAIPK